jgi:hypothetical protein
MQPRIESSPTPRQIVDWAGSAIADRNLNGNRSKPNPHRIGKLGDRVLHAHEIINLKTEAWRWSLRRDLEENRSLEMAFETGFGRKPKQTLGSSLSLPRHMRCILSSIDPMPVFYILHHNHFAQPCHEPSLGASPHYHWRLKLEPCRHASCSKAPHWLKTPLVNSSHPTSLVGRETTENGAP